MAGLLAALAVQLAHGLRADGLTNDEVLYVSAGWRQLALGDHRLNTTHPPLGPDLAALGLLGLRPRTADLADGGDVMAYAYRFVHVDNDAAAVITRARVPVALATLCLALLCWAWAREAAGPLAGLLTLVLACFHPSLIAHGHLATTDVPAAFAMLAASWCFWRWTRRPGIAWAAATAVALGAAAATRLTAWVLVPCFALIALARIGRAPAGERGRAVRAALALALAAAVLLPLVIWAAYGFGAAAEHLLPRAYVEAARFQLGHNRRGHLAYLLGERSREGWPHYFVVALLVKSTPGYLAALGLAAAARPRRLAPLAHWLLPAALTMAAVSAGRIQIGERYLLPVHAYLLPLLGCALARWLETGGRARARAAAVGAALLLHAVPCLLAARRGHLAYFNLLAGGPAGGHRVLLDSNLDWGQDLPRLAEWMRRHRVATVQLAYMGADDPRRHGIQHEDLPGQTLYPQRPAQRPLAGTVVVSPNLLYGLVPAVAATYEPLRSRGPDARAGIFFVYRLPGP